MTITLKERLNQDTTTALKQGDAVTLKTLRYARGIIQGEEKKSKTGAEFTDEQVQKALASIAKQMRDNITLYTEKNLPEALAEAQAELVVIEKYLPQQLTEAEVRKIVRNVLSTVGTSAHTGLIMKAVMAETKNRADGKLVKSIVDQELA